jgi:hypothetical protein
MPEIPSNRARSKRKISIDSGNVKQERCVALELVDCDILIIFEYHALHSPILKQIVAARGKI